MIDLEQIAQEDALFPWLASDCMADEYQESEPDFSDPDEDCDED